MPKEGKEIRIGYRDQGTFATAELDNATYTEINCEPMEVDRDMRSHELSNKSGNRQTNYLDRLVNSQGSMPKFATKGPFSRNESDFFTYAFTQKVVELSTPFKKTFTYFASHPDFAASGGKFLTIIKRYPTSSTSWKMDSCVANKIKFEAERDGMLMMETSWIGRSDVDETSNPSGTWERGLDGPGGSDDHDDAYGILFFNDLDVVTLKFDAKSGTVSSAADQGGGLVRLTTSAAHGLLKGQHVTIAGTTDYNGTFEVKAVAATTTFDITDTWVTNQSGTFVAAHQSVLLKRFAIELEHDVEGIGPDGSGSNTDFGISNYRGTIELEFLKDVAFEASMAGQELNQFFEAKLGWGAAGAASDGELEFTITAKMIEGPTQNEDGLITGTLKGEILAANRSSEGFQMIMTNLIDRSWPAS